MPSVRGLLQIFQVHLLKPSGRKDNGSEEWLMVAKICKAKGDDGFKKKL